MRRLGKHFIVQCLEIDPGWSSFAHDLAPVGNNRFDVALGGPTQQEVGFRREIVAQEIIGDRVVVEHYKVGWTAGGDLAKTIIAGDRPLTSIFGMTDEVWRRHANPWSVWTRYMAGPLLVLAIWSRAWIDWWAVVPIAVMILWIWLNPRVFRIPRSTTAWASRAVLGERIWLNRTTVAIDQRIVRLSHLANLCGLIGLALLVWGLVVYSELLTVGGLAIVLAAKSWFLQKMVKLYDATPVADRPS